MTAVEFDVDGVDAVLPGDEPDSVLVWRMEQRAILVKSGRSSGSSSGGLRPATRCAILGHYSKRNTARETR